MEKKRKDQGLKVENAFWSQNPNFKVLILPSYPSLLFQRVAKVAYGLAAGAVMGSKAQLHKTNENTMPKGKKPLDLAIAKRDWEWI